MGLYEPPEEDLEREDIVSSWNTSDIMDFLYEEYEDPVEEFGFESRHELENYVADHHAYDEDWVEEDLSDMPEIEIETRNSCGLAKPDSDYDSDPRLFPKWKQGFHKKGAPEEGVVYNPR